MQQPFGQNYSRPSQNQSINYNTFEFEKTAIIRPPFEEFKNKEINNKHTRYVIDSRDRNTDLFPSPAQYEINMDEEIEDVTSAEIVIAEVPLSAYMVNENNNRLHVTVGGNPYVVYVETGDYTPADLASALQLALNNTLPALFAVQYSNLKDNYVITSNTPFVIEAKQTDANAYATKSIARMLGLPPKNLASVVEAVPDVNGYYNFVRATYRRNFDLSKYVVLHIEQMNINHSTNTTINRSFALVQQQLVGLNIFSHTAPSRKYFNPPVGRLTKIKLTFKDYDGNLYDFQNKEHRIEIIFESNKHLRKYKDFMA